uniref:Uncharacterized protein n=1 Tax=Arundo donax TaxID=35708 RepID=A0A0A9CLF5_ARUDO
MHLPFLSGTMPETQKQDAFSSITPKKRKEKGNSTRQPWHNEVKQQWPCRNPVDTLPKGPIYAW